MADLTVENIIKIILGILVFIIVVVGAYFFFKNYVIDFFNNIAGDNKAKAASLVLNLIK